jgi:hypothetical protein
MTMMTTANLLLVVMALLASPFITFFVVKFGTFGFYVGRHQFYSYIRDKEHNEHT